MDIPVNHLASRYGLFTNTISGSNLFQRLFALYIVSDTVCELDTGGRIT